MSWKLSNLHFREWSDMHSQFLNGDQTDNINVYWNNHPRLQSHEITKYHETMFTSQVSNAGSLNSPNKCLGFQEDVQWKSSKFTELWFQRDTVDSKLAAQTS